jgi:hypothetical protein
MLPQASISKGEIPVEVAAPVPVICWPSQSVAHPVLSFNYWKVCWPVHTGEMPIDPRKLKAHPNTRAARFLGVWRTFNVAELPGGIAVGGCLKQ